MEDVDSVLAATVVVGKLLTTDGTWLGLNELPFLSAMIFPVWARLEPTVARFSKALSANEFAHALGSLYRAVSGGRVKNERLFFLILSSIFVRNSPDGKVLSGKFVMTALTRRSKTGSFKINQEYTSRCLHTIPRLDLITDSDLTNSGLKIILELVGDKVSRSFNLGYS
jgi:hypothetical protein